MTMITDTIGAGRPLRSCAVCLTVDDHPRHVVGRVASRSLPRPDAGAVQELLDRLVDDVLDGDGTHSSANISRIEAELSGERGLTLHMDCCRAQGCPDGSCDLVSGLRGEDLLIHIQSKANDEGAYGA